MDDDEEEMAALRRSRNAHFQQHQHHRQPSPSTDTIAAPLPSAPLPSVSPRSDASHEQQTATAMSSSSISTPFKFQPLILSSLPPVIAPAAAARQEDEKEAKSAEAQDDDDDDDDAEAAALRAFLPQSFGGKKDDKKAAAKDVHAANRRPPLLPASSAHLAFSERKEADDTAAVVVKRERREDSDDDSDDDDDDRSSAASSAPSPLDRYRLPISHSVSIPSSTKSVSALSLTSSGARLLSGSSDYELRLYDLHTLTSSLSPFRSLTPHDGHPVLVARFCPFEGGNDGILVAGGGVVKLLDREGRTQLTTVRGDQYLLDQRHTRGHTAAVTDLRWQPAEQRGLFATAARDGTVRLWDMQWKDGQENKEVVRMRGLQRGIAVSSLCFTRTGSVMAAACSDGGVRLFHRAGMKWSERMSSQTAAAGQEDWISDAVIMSDERRLLLRRRDGVTMLDVRMLKVELGRAALPAQHEQSDIAFSPDESLLLTGTEGNLAFISTSPASSASASPASASSPPSSLSSSLSLLSLLPLSPRELIRCVYHPALNQIFVSSSAGSIHCLYSPSLSHRGVVLASSRAARPVPAPNPLHVGVIVAPHAQPEGRKRKRGQEEQRERDRRAPLPPVGGLRGRGEGGRLATTASLTQSMMRKIVEKKINVREVDPRDALLAVEERMRKEGGKKLFTAAYDTTQPVPIFQAEDDDDTAADGDGGSQR